jgi:TetR/AcrR family transcriptional regulator, cholesterol catabolism regulator
MTHRALKKKIETKRRAPVRTSREEIQAKAMELFLSKGYQGMSTTEICEGLGISRPTLYWYFEDKENILFSVHKDAIESRIQPMVARMNEIDDPMLRLHLFIREYTSSVCLYSDAKVLIKETDSLAPEHAAWVRKHWTDLLESVRGAIRELKARGKIKDLPELFVAFSLIGMVTWPSTWFDPSRTEEFESLIETIEEVFLSGILKPENSSGSHCLDNLDSAATKFRRQPKKNIGTRAAAKSTRNGKTRTA